MLERALDRARFVFNAMYTPSGADWEASTLPSSFFILYRLTRPFRLLRTYGTRLASNPLAYTRSDDQPGRYEARR
jgi:hypothetical protein